MRIILSLKRESSKTEQGMWTESGIGGRDKAERGGEWNQKKAFMADLVGESKKKK